MDGVLIDVSRSYRQTILKTIQIYLKRGFDVEKGEKFVSCEVISLFKSVGRFNNDWDLTSGILLYLLSLSGLPPCRRRRSFHRPQEVVSYLIKKSDGFQWERENLLAKKGLSHFLEKVKSHGGGLKGVRLTLKDSWEGWVYHEGDLHRENLVKRIFQEVYLGEKFVDIYGVSPLFYHGNGLYRYERLLFPRRFLSSLHRKIRMGIASGRPRVEAELALGRFNLNSYFDHVVTLDECKEEEERVYLSTGKRRTFSKPHPYELLRVISDLRLSNPRCGYIGDTVDDIRAAMAARKKVPMLAIGYLGSSPKKSSLRESLLQAGADVVISKPHELFKWIQDP